MKYYIFLLIVFTFWYSQSQNYIGLNTDNYSGIYTLTYNPANVVSSKYRTDINIFAVSSFAGSDYFDINISDLSNIGDDFDFEDDIVTSPSDNNNFFVNADIMLPSFMMNLSDKSSIGLLLRLRAFANVRDINGVLFENLVNDFDDGEDFDFQSQNLATVNHAWGEIGLTYGRILIEKPKHMLSGGATFKYLMGAGVTYANTPDLTGNYEAATETLTTNGFLNYGSNIDIDEDFDFSFEDSPSGFGLDIGFNYEYHPDREENDGLKHYQSNYKFKISASVTDIGSISYENSTVYSYDMNDSVSVSDIGDIRDFLDESYKSEETSSNIKINLPTAFHLMFDYRLTSKWLLNAQANLSLVGDDQLQSNNIINTYTLTPRYQTRVFSFLTPVSIREHGDFAWGAGIRLGPFTVGSGSVFSNLLSDNSQTTDVFVGFKVPIYRKKNS